MTVSKNSSNAFTVFLVSFIYKCLVYIIREENQYNSNPTSTAKLPNLPKRGSDVDKNLLILILFNSFVILRLQNYALTSGN